MACRQGFVSKIMKIYGYLSLFSDKMMSML